MSHRSTPPRAARHPRVHTIHGIRREDPYAWLRDDDWQTVMRNPAALHPDIRAHLEAENAHTL
jgi:oligopeptidase B